MSGDGDAARRSARKAWRSPTGSTSNWTSDCSRWLALQFTANTAFFSADFAIASDYSRKALDVARRLMLSRMRA